VSVLAAYFLAVPQMMLNDIPAAKAYGAIPVVLMSALHTVEHPSKQFFAINEFNRRPLGLRKPTSITAESAKLQNAWHKDGVKSISFVDLQIICRGAQLMLLFPHLE
jgi:hypothetical protein